MKKYKKLRLFVTFDCEPRTYEAFMNNSGEITIIEAQADNEFGIINQIVIDHKTLKELTDFFNDQWEVEND